MNAGRARLKADNALAREKWGNRLYTAAPANTSPEGGKLIFRANDKPGKIEEAEL